MLSFCLVIKSSTKVVQSKFPVIEEFLGLNALVSATVKFEKLSAQSREKFGRKYCVTELNSELFNLLLFLFILAFL